MQNEEQNYFGCEVTCKECGEPRNNMKGLVWKSGYHLNCQRCKRCNKKGLWWSELKEGYHRYCKCQLLEQ